MVIKRKIVEKSLLLKGFVRDSNDHNYFYHEYNGKRTGAYTYTSHGGHGGDIDDRLINIMKKELRLIRDRQAKDLLLCPMSRDEYNRIIMSIP